MKQVLVIHGGDSFATYEEYLNDLREHEVTIDDQSKGWKSLLAEALGATYQVILPRMPNATNARFLEWKIWFEKYLHLLNDDVLLVGHSLGGSFLAKYLATEEPARRIRGTFLVAAPYATDGGRALVEFDVPQSLSKFEAQGGELFLYHSTDDPIVTYAESIKFKQALPRARFRSFSNRGHFLQSTFPELVEDIRSLD